jgi:hypothetical protein
LVFCVGCRHACARHPKGLNAMAQAAFDGFVPVVWLAFTARVLNTCQEYLHLFRIFTSFSKKHATD